MNIGILEIIGTFALVSVILPFALVPGVIVWYWIEDYRCRNKYAITVKKGKKEQEEYLRNFYDSVNNW